jgi:hypothetical protein
MGGFAAAAEVLICVATDVTLFVDWDICATQVIGNINNQRSWFFIMLES